MRRVNEDVEGQTVHQNSHSATRVKSRKSVSRSSELICCRTLSSAVSRALIEPLSALPSLGRQLDSNCSARFCSVLRHESFLGQ